MSMLKLLVVHDVFGLDKHLLISFLDYFECLNGVLWLRDGRLDMNFNVVVLN